jgi:DNA-binding MarR family transcriptional regulator
MVTTKVEPRTANVADNRLLPLVEHLARVGRRAGETTLAPGGLRPRHLIALRLLRDAGPTSQQGLADSLSLDPSNVVGLLNELEERELVTRRRDPVDRRRHIVELSRRGDEELCLAFTRLRLVEDDVFSALSDAERATLYELLVRAVGVISPPCDVVEETLSCPA